MAINQILAFFYCDLASEVSSISAPNGCRAYAVDTGLNYVRVSGVWNKIQDETFGTSSSGKVPASGGGTSKYLRADATWVAPPGTIKVINVVFGDGFDIPIIGSKAIIARIPFGGTVNDWSVEGNISGSATIDVQKASDSATPSYSSMVGAGTKPSISSVVASNGNSISNWDSTTFSSGDKLRFNLDNVSTCKMITLSLKITVS